MPVLVRESRTGGHIAGLSKDKFHVRENNVPQKIAFFEEISSTSALYEPANPAPGTFSNLVNTAKKHARLTILLLDTVNTEFLDQAYARHSLLKFLGAASEGEGVLCVLHLSHAGIRELHKCDSDPKVLAMALQGVRSRGGPPDVPANPASKQRGNSEPSPPSLQDGQSATLHVAVQREQTQLQNFVDVGDIVDGLSRKMAAESTVDALQEVTQAVAGIPGRKSLIWVTGGFPLMPDEGVRQRFRRTWEMLADANVALYSIDARGLVNTYYWSPANSGTPDVNYSSRQTASFLARLDALKMLSEGSGGRVFYNRNDLDGCIQEAASDSSAYYLLGYYLKREGKSPGWRHLDVRVDHSGINVRARTGFYLTTAPKQADEAADLNVAATSSLEYTAVPMVGRWLGSTGDSVKTVSFALTLPPQAALVANGNRMDLSVGVIARDLVGNVANRNDKRVTAQLSPESLATAEKEGFNFTGTIDLLPGKYSVRFIVRDAFSGRIGTVTTPLDVH